MTIAEKIIDKQSKIEQIQQRIEIDRDRIRRLQREISGLRNQEIIQTINEINIPASELREILEQIKNGTYGKVSFQKN